MDARTKKLTDAAYSPTIAASEEAIRAQVDGSIQEVYDIVNTAKTDKNGDHAGTWQGLRPTQAEPGLSATVEALKSEFNTHLADNVTDADGAHGLIVEDGTFTPVLKFGGNNVGMTFVRQSGRYKRIGNLINYEIDIALSAKGTSTGSATIEGLPFAASAARPIRYHTFAGLTYITHPATSKGIVGNITLSSAQIAIQYIVDSAGSSAINATNFADNSQFQICGSYYI